VIIQQAIYGSARATNASGYHMLAKSSGLGEEVTRELIQWCPSHDSLAGGALRLSINYHPLANGLMCVSKTVLAGAEYSGRSGENVLSHCLVAEREAWVAVANNPFAMLRAVEASGRLAAACPGTNLLPIEVQATSPLLDETGIRRGRRSCGPPGIRVLLQAILAGKRIVLQGDHGEAACALAINLLPLFWRKNCSFSTGLKYSPRRPFQIVVIGSDQNEARRMTRGEEFVLVDLGLASSSRPLPMSRWAHFVCNCLAKDDFVTLKKALELSRPAELASDLDEVVEQLDGPSNSPPTASLSKPTAVQPGPAASPSAASRADGSHASFIASNPVVTPPNLSKKQPSKIINPLDPQVMELLEHLDDAVFGAMSGDKDALSRVEVIWPVVMSELGGQLVEESREHYLRFALEAWSLASQMHKRRPEQAVAALDVLRLLFVEHDSGGRRTAGRTS
jgi:hypothetical protein